MKMQKTIFQAKVTTVLQVTAGQPLEAIVFEGKIFVEYPMPIGVVAAMDGAVAPGASEVGEVITGEKAALVGTVAKARESKKVEDVAIAKKEVAEKEVAKAAKKVSKSVTYTETELMDVAKFPVAKLMKIIEERGITIPDAGKNTNKKLRLLILDAQNHSVEDNYDGDEDEDEDDVEDDAPVVTKKGKKAVAVETEEEEDEEDDEPTEEEDIATLVKLFTDFDDVEIDEVQLLAGLEAFGYAKSDAEDIIADFEEDTESEIADFVANLLGEDEDEDAEDVDEDEDFEDEEDEEDEEEPAPKATKKGSGKKESKKKAVAIADLKKGDKVSVYFESEEDFFNGVVASVGRGNKVTVDFDDDTTDVLDAEENTTIHLI